MFELYFILEGPELPHRRFCIRYSRTADISYATLLLSLDCSLFRFLLTLPACFRALTLPLPITLCAVRSIPASPFTLPPSLVHVLRFNFSLTALFHAFTSGLAPIHLCSLMPVFRRRYGSVCNSAPFPGRRGVTLTAFVVGRAPQGIVLRRIERSSP